MDDQDTEQVTAPTAPDRAAEVTSGQGRSDDRNDELDQPPVPDPETSDPSAEDDPEAD